MVLMSSIVRRHRGYACLLTALGSTAIAAFMGHDKRRPTSRTVWCEGAVSCSSSLEPLSGWEPMPIPHRGADTSHAIYGPLFRSNLIERYNVYKNVREQSVRADIEIGCGLNGHPSIVHGGILALLMDDTLGFGFDSLGIEAAVTANLNIDYVQPVPEQCHIHIVAHLDHREGRKLYWTVQVLDARDHTMVYCNATSLFIIPRSVYEKTNNETQMAA